MVISALMTATAVWSHNPDGKVSAIASSVEQQLHRPTVKVDLGPVKIDKAPLHPFADEIIKTNNWPTFVGRATSKVYPSIDTT